MAIDPTGANLKRFLQEDEGLVHRQQEPSPVVARFIELHR